jgi:hypothetical protein
MDSQAALPPQVVVPSFVTPDFSWIGGHLDAGGITSVVFAILFVWWAIFTLVALYHWVRFGRLTWFAVPVFGAHLYVSYVLLTYLTSGLH